MLLLIIVFFNVDKMSDFFALYNEELDYRNDGYFFTKLNNENNASEGKLFKKTDKLKLINLLIPIDPSIKYNQSFVDYSKKIKNLPEITWDLDDAQMIIHSSYYKYATSFQRSNISNKTIATGIYYGSSVKLNFITMSNHI